MFEQAEFFGRERDFCLVHGDFVSCKVHHQIAILVPGRALARFPVESAEEGFDPGDERLRAEGFGYVVVGPQLQPYDGVRFFGFGGQHNDGDHGGFRSRPQSFADLETVDLRQHQVEDDQVGLLLFRVLKTFRAGFGRDRSKALFLQIEFDQLENVVLVFNDENFFAGWVGHSESREPTRETASCQGRMRRWNGPIGLTERAVLTYGGRQLSASIWARMWSCTYEGKVAVMKIYLTNPRGFCAGVDRAIDIVDLSLKKYGAPIYVRHEIVHSRHVVNSLRDKGAVFVEELGEVPEGSVVIFSAHGVAKSVWDEANRRGLHVIDATCPLVIKVHNEVNRDYTQGYDLILIGHAGHPEVIGTLGQIPDKFHLVSSVEDVKKLQVDQTHDLSYVTQTTLSVDECRDIVGALHERFPHIKGPHQEDICYATQNRQNAVKELSLLVDVILVIGSPNSSNSNRLRELGERCGIASYLIDAASDINPEWLANVKAIGITAGASAPEVLVEEVVTYLKTFGPAEVEDLTVIEEDVEFLLPKELITIESSNRSVEA